MTFSVSFRIKQLLKMSLQNLILPAAYSFWHLVYRNRKKELILLADSHHDRLPYSLENLHAALINRGYQPVLNVHDYATQSAVASALHALSFMKLYAQAGYVFICDNFLPVVSCKKSKDTTVVQVWHSCGLLKKIGYDTTEDIPAGYRGSVYRNYDLVTVSSPDCIQPFANCMRLPADVVQSLGISRTDNYFHEDWKKSCADEFYRQHPDAYGKKIILWAPTFRGNAAEPYQVGLEPVQKLAADLPEEYYLLIKVHPHVDKKYHLSNCNIPTERLFPVTDLLITDYSSTVCEFMMFRKPYLMFAPDLEDFRQKRGFHVPYESLSPYLVTDPEKLKDTVIEAVNTTDLGWIDAQCRYHNGSCDGHSTDRLLDQLGL